MLPVATMTYLSGSGPGPLRAFTAKRSSRARSMRASMPFFGGAFESALRLLGGEETAPAAPVVFGPERETLGRFLHS